MRSHKLAKWLLGRDDAEVFISTAEPHGKEPLSKEFTVSGMLGYSSTKEDGLILTAKKIMNFEEQVKYQNKLEDICRNHPDRILLPRNVFEGTDKEYVENFIQVAKSKGYTILPANDLVRKRLGVVIFKEIEGVELAYNPTWPEEEGEISY